ncbi:MAG: helicase SNF2 [Candidatus Firestonebacteria bacterium RIFOXYC2_FULL_39_67]|nr:MAG: helicase SNF2 [Candidatus Firestonebacteria bacterium RIFOXYD2_FULL_39_29]OGF56644.1 MAG: helicase SNF2 [Candidatus Firestonebacteria bacterium RIFOXYC2_FULL_39_67]OGF57120.1 MAG: helicase SNF2 [Candidatus Firestonebacteria bacterium RifOxyC12_full_39_7]
MYKELTAVCLPDQSIELEWRKIEDPVNKSQELLQNELYKRYTEDFSSFILFLGFSSQSTPLSASLDFFRKSTGLYVKKLTQTPDLEVLRESVKPDLTIAEIDDLLSRLPFMVGSEYITPAFLETIWVKLDTAFKNKLKTHKSSVDELIKTFSPDVHLAGRVYFHLVESKNEDLPFAFLATYSTSLNEQGKYRHVPLKHALLEHGKNSKKLLELLSTVHLAAKESRIVAGLIENGEIFHPIALSAKDAYNILEEIPVYEKYGILCRIPNWWKNRTSTLKLDIRIGNSSPSFLGKDSILDFEIKLLSGDLELTEKETIKLLNESEGLAFIKGKWMEVNPENLKKTLEAYKKARQMMDKGGLSLKEAMHLQLNLQKDLGILNDETVEISGGDWLKSVIEKLRKPELIASVSIPNNFKGELRPYQQKGLNWLYFLHSLQFGACLADDMGLGKTIQLLAFLNALKANKQEPASLLIIPASLISNWINEIQRFSPDLKYHIAHPVFEESNYAAGPDKDFIDKYDLVITTYSLSKKYDWLKTYKWNYVILDEAQAIKNPGTKQTRAVKTLNANNRIIMTGTPIENSLGDLWSLFDFLNPGLLGSVKEFSNFSKKLKDNPDGYTKLKNITSPYILRRLKTDKSVISDLPDKVEMKTYSDLSKKQVVLYGKLVEEIKTMLKDKTEGIERKGLILASLMKFKQLCNHPDQYLGRDEYSELDSGKFLRLREICETIFEKRERVLIFTQFKEITEPLKEYLETIFKHKGLVFHGSTPVNERKDIVEKFQGHEYVPFMVLSIKAGGVGLNLTAANHVIHFDRWWNPAVENQATDRVFRIGQKKNVIVHKFITRGTLEEKIDAMLQEKSNLSNEIIQSSNASWITEMNNDKLMNLFSLSL